MKINFIMEKNELVVFIDPGRRKYVIMETMDFDEYYNNHLLAQKEDARYNSLSNEKEVRK